MAKRKHSQPDLVRASLTIPREYNSPGLPKKGRSIDDYTVGWICALQEEYESACRMLDEEFDELEVGVSDDNLYTFGRIGAHYMAIGCLPAGVYGTNSAARVARDMVRSFPCLRFALMVGIAGGLPTADDDVRLGDVVVSMPCGSSGGVVQYDMGKRLTGGYFEPTGHLNAPPAKLLAVLRVLRRRYNDPKQHDRIAEHMHRMDDMLDYRRPSNDQLYLTDYPHQAGRNCTLCDSKYLVPRPDRRGRLVTVHYGTIASGNSLIKDAALRDEFANSEMRPLCFEMEAAGLMNNLPCLVIRGICDYADSHKNDVWHKYAALAAAAYGRELLLTLEASKVAALPSWADEIKTSLSSVSEDVRQIQSCIDDERLRRWLSPVDPSRNFNTALDSLMPGTGNWLLNNKAYKNWKDQKGSIWLYGPPGSGKTMLTTLVIHDCEAKMFIPSNALLYFYFDFADSDKLTHDAMLRSIIWQLAINDPKVREPLDALFKACNQGQKQPLRRQLSGAFGDMAAKMNDIYLVIDAIDECTDREQLMWLLRYLTLGEKSNVHLCVSSRQEKDIEERLQPIVGKPGRIGLARDLVNVDIHHYIRQRLEVDQALGKWKKLPNIQREIEDKIMRQADGMFLWAVCQLDSVQECVDLPMLRQRLAALTKTVEETYFRILSGIIDSHKIYALRVLQWLVYAARPLRIEEIIDVVAVRLEGVPAFDPQNRLVDVNDILSICSSLVTIEGPEDAQVVRLSHMAVRDYLLSGHARAILNDAMEKETANAAIAATCLKYILHLEDHPADSSIFQAFPLTSYAVQRWPSHALAAKETAKNLLLLIEELFVVRRKAFSLWARLFAAPVPRWRPGDAFRWANNVSSITDSPRLITFSETPMLVGRKRFSTVTDHSPLFYACLIGLTRTVSLLLDKGADPNVYCAAYGGSPLQIASHLGHVAVARALLAKGANPNQCDNNSRTALQLAAFGGYEGIVRVLLARGADPNLTSRTHGTSLHAALAMGHQHIAIMLLDNGADPNTHCWWYGSVLQVALMLAFDPVVQHLLDKGADPNANSGRYGTALQIAAERGSVQSVRALLDKGASPNTYNKSFDSPLGQALYHSHAGIVDLLLKAGVELQPRVCGTALELAAYDGNQQMVRTLIENGLDVDSCRGHYETALWMASSQGHGGIVQLLVAKCQGVLASFRLLELAKEWATRREHYDILPLLRREVGQRPMISCVSKKAPNNLR
ncbi:hypothetical protein BDW68DRAFT_180949 [Aspergillus falconensis]